MSKWEIYTDGAYSSSRKQGGIGIVFIKDGELAYTYSKSYKNTTNNQMELIAALTAFNAFSKPVKSITLYTDSMYMYGCANLDWQRKKNIKLWDKFDKAFDKALKLSEEGITMIPIRGHQKDDSINTKYNNLADKLAVEASKL